MTDPGDDYSALPDVKKVYPDAYIKYSGDYKLPADSDLRYEIDVSAFDGVLSKDDKLKIRVLREDITEEYIIDSDTVFDESCKMEYFEGYEEGDMVLEWYKRVMTMPADSFIGGYPPLVGVFDISVTGNHIDRYYGAYWWD